MLQPFIPFKIPYTVRLKKLGKKYLVTQTYTRGVTLFMQSHQTPILLTDYDDMGLAKIHFNAVKTDKYASIINLDKPLHENKLIEMGSAASNYNLYWGIVKDAAELKKIIDRNYADRLKKYIDKNTNWRISRDTTLKANLELTFGELFIIMKHAGQTIRCKFEEIENL